MLLLSFETTNLPVTTSTTIIATIYLSTSDKADSFQKYYRIGDMGLYVQLKKKSIHKKDFENMHAALRETV